jgi:hypothetical protein
LLFCSIISRKKTKRKKKTKNRPIQINSNTSELLQNAHSVVQVDSHSINNSRGALQSTNLCAALCALSADGFYRHKLLAAFYRNAREPASFAGRDTPRDISRVEGNTRRETKVHLHQTERIVTPQSTGNFPLPASGRVLNVWHASLLI